LGGWLVEEEEAESGTSGRATGMANQIHSSAGLSAEDEEESEDGLSLLEREARRKERMKKETEAGLGIKKKKRNRTRSECLVHKKPSQFHR
jgi:glycine/D-amino acid oxidase-like deaminating enzyme